MRTLGIDVSHWEGVIDWNIARHYANFVYYKCTDGIAGTDVEFNSNRVKCNFFDVPSAPFHWYKPDQSPVSQAVHFISVAGNKYKQYIIDVEEASQVNQDKVVFWKNLWNMINQIKTLIGHFPMIYTGAYFWNEHVSPNYNILNCDLILARYCYAKNPVPPEPWKSNKVKPKVWQFTDYGFCPGMGNTEGNVDMDWFYGTPDECREYFGVGG